MKILFFKLGAIGDVLMTTPLVRQARKNFPDAKIDYLVGAHSGTFLKTNKSINRVVEFDEQIFTKRDIRKYLRLVSDIRRNRYDMIFVLDKHWVFNLASLLACIKKRIGFKRGIEGLFLTKKIPRDRPRHEILYYLDLARIAGLDVDYSDVQMDLVVSRKDEEYVNTILRKHNVAKEFFVVSNSGGNNPAEKNPVRQLPDELFEKIVAGCSKKHLVCFVGLANEKGYYDRFLFNSNCRNLAGLTNVQQCAALCKRARKIITTDTGTMHIAAAVNKKIISIFGPTDPARKAPLHKESKSIWCDQEVYDVRYELSGRIPEAKFFTKLDADDVLQIIERI